MADKSAYVPPDAGGGGARAAELDVDLDEELFGKVRLPPSPATSRRSRRLPLRPLLPRRLLSRRPHPPRPRRSPTRSRRPTRRPTLARSEGQMNKSIALDAFFFCSMTHRLLPRRRLFLAHRCGTGGRRCLLCSCQRRLRRRRRGDSRCAGRRCRAGHGGGRLLRRRCRIRLTRQFFDSFILTLDAK